MWTVLQITTIWHSSTERLRNWLVTVAQPHTQRKKDLLSGFMSGKGEWLAQFCRSGPTTNQHCKIDNWFDLCSMNINIPQSEPCCIMIKNNSPTCVADSYCLSNCSHPVINPSRKCNSWVVQKGRRALKSETRKWGWVMLTSHPSHDIVLVIDETSAWRIAHSVGVLWLIACISSPTSN